jgi:Protein of unknown function (DUF3761)
MARPKMWMGIIAFLCLVLTPGIPKARTNQSQQTPQSSEAQQSGTDKSKQEKQTPSNTSTKSDATSKPRYYTNRAGQRIQSPTKSNSVPAGATAQCRDGSYSFSQNHRGTCSHHGGVAKWL